MAKLNLLKLCCRNFAMAATKRPLVLVDCFEHENTRVGLNRKTQTLLEQWFQVVSVPQCEKAPDLWSQVQGFAIGPTRLLKLREKLDMMTSLKAVAMPATGLDKVPRDDILTRGLLLGNAPASEQQNKTVADFALLMLLAASRNFVKETAHVSLNPGQLFPIRSRAHDVTYKTLGVVGMGRIGLEIAKRAKAFDMNILYHNRTERLDDVTEHLQAIYYDNLHAMLPDCDFVVIACPLNKDSLHLIAEKELHLMKHSTILINIARGAIVDTRALVEALQTHQIHGAALDVTDPEPLPPGHPLLTLPNVIITPHCASHTYEAKHEVWTMVVDNLKAALIHNTPMPYAVDVMNNKEVGCMLNYQDSQTSPSPWKLEVNTPFHTESAASTRDAQLPNWKH